jgi:hypothetical protein
LEGNVYFFDEHFEGVGGCFTGLSPFNAFESGACSGCVAAVGCD